MSKPQTVGEALSYIERHESMFGFKPARLYLDAPAYAEMVRLIQSSRYYTSSDDCGPLQKLELMGVPTFLGCA